MLAVSDRADTFIEAVGVLNPTWRKTGGSSEDEVEEDGGVAGGGVVGKRKSGEADRKIDSWHHRSSHDDTEADDDGQKYTARYVDLLNQMKAYHEKSNHLDVIRVFGEMKEAAADENNFISIDSPKVYRMLMEAVYERSRPVVGDIRDERDSIQIRQVNVCVRACVLADIDVNPSLHRSCFSSSYASFV